MPRTVNYQKTLFERWFQFVSEKKNAGRAKSLIERMVGPYDREEVTERMLKSDFHGFWLNYPYCDTMVRDYMVKVAESFLI